MTETSNGIQPGKVWRYITLHALDGKQVPLGVYVQGIKMAKAHPDTEFRTGLTCWWPCTGREILAQFREGMHDRINAGIPYRKRVSQDRS